MFKVIIFITTDDAELWIQFDSKSLWETPTKTCLSQSVDLEAHLKIEIIKDSLEVVKRYANQNSRRNFSSSRHGDSHVDLMTINLHFARKKTFFLFVLKFIDVTRFTNKLKRFCYSKTPFSEHENFL